jgi:phospholipid/cholesterol/gamma-HCH transport system substrate-binding protein
LVSNNNKLNSTIDNLQTTSKNLSNLDLKSTLFKLDSSISGLKTTIGKINSKDGSLGLLLNDPTLYNNLSSTSNKINVLIDDLRLHPKRYVSFSVFGKADKKQNPLNTPLPDTLNAPYLQPTKP